MASVKSPKKRSAPSESDKSGSHSNALLFASTNASSAAAGEENVALQHFSCAMTNKNGIKTPYILQLGEGQVKVISFSKGQVKATLSLSTMHAKMASKQTRNKMSEASEETKSEGSWYPLKLMLSLKKSRMLYFDSRRQRKEVLEAILTE